MGRALQGIDRDDYVLATKVYFPMGEGPNDRGLSRKHIMEQCERSLRRLGVDYVDLYQCHRPDPETPIEETLRAFDDLVTPGQGALLRRVGVDRGAAPGGARHLRSGCGSTRSPPTSRSTRCSTARSSAR